MKVSTVVVNFILLDTGIRIDIILVKEKIMRITEVVRIRDNSAMIIIKEATAKGKRVITMKVILMTLIITQAGASIFVTVTGGLHSSS